MIKIILRAILLALIPGLLVYLGRADNILDYLKKHKYLGENFNIDLLKYILLVCGVTFTSLIYVVMESRARYKYNIAQSQKTALIYMLKQGLLTSLENLTGDTYIRDSVNIRIWVEDRKYYTGIVDCIKKKMGKPIKKVFTIRNVDGFTNSSVNNMDLKMEVEPISQGVLGRSYHEKGIVYDEDVTESETDYKLTPSQEVKTIGTRFVLCSPIIGNKDRILHIISFDSAHKITIPQENESKVAALITVFGQDLYQHVPDIFK